MTAEPWIDLRCFPSQCPETVRAVRVRVRRSANAELRISFQLDGNVTRILIPPPSAPRFATELWRHTCFEAFIAIEGKSAYYEFNFAPSGEWAVYGFRSYREGGPLVDNTMRPHIAVRATDSHFELDGLVRLDALSPALPLAPLRIGLSAVIETSEGLSYWALLHPLDKPDFHHVDGFALLLASPVV
jgi:hypothetical protein